MEQQIGNWDNQKNPEKMLNNSKNKTNHNKEANVRRDDNDPDNSGEGVSQKKKPDDTNDFNRRKTG